jgi:hypothetical protein
LQPQTAQQLQAAFPLATRSEQVAWFGQDQAAEPPDTQVAAGPTQLLEMTNSAGSVWSKTGGPVLAYVDLNAFYAAPAGFVVSDPRVFYDAAAGRWFSSVMAFDANNDGRVYEAVSQSGDPLGLWWVYTVAANNSGTLYDQPTLGVDSDKVFVSWNDFSSTSFLGQETWLADKAALVSGQSPAVTAFGPDPNRASLVAATSQSGTTTAYLAYNRSLLRGSPYAGPYVGLVAITGNPAQANVLWSEQAVAIVPTSVPPDAQQPGPNPLISTGDDRFLSAVWQNDTLWVGGNDACNFSGDTAVRSCARLIRLTTTATASVQEDIDAGAAGSYVYYPAAAMDSAGNMLFVFSQSASNLYPSVFASGEQANTSGLMPESAIAAGVGPYNCGSVCALHGAVRWGDYSAAAIDPVAPTTVWLAGEYAVDQLDPNNWGTAAGSLTLASAPPSPPHENGPTISSWGRGRLDVFMKGADGALWHKFYDASVGWQGWSSLGAPPIGVTLASDPVAISWGYARIDIFVRGSDNALWHKYYDVNLGGWSGWYSHGETLTSGPTATSWGSGRLDVLYRGSDNTLRHIFYASSIGAWSGEYNHGGALASDPSAITWGYGRIDVVARGADGTLQHDDYDLSAGGWLTNWESLGGSLISRPAITTWGPRRLDVFAVGNDNTLQHTYFYAGTWQGWSSQGTLNGTLMTSNPGAIAWSAGRLDIFVRGQGNTLWHKFYDSSVGWSGWYSESLSPVPG